MKFPMKPSVIYPSEPLGDIDVSKCDYDDCRTSVRYRPPCGMLDRSRDA